MTKQRNNSGAPALVPQPNGGALWSGGVPGNRGGTGRPSAAIKAEFRQILDEGLPKLREVIEGKVRVPLVGICEKCGHEHENAPLTQGDLVLLQKPEVSDQLRALEMGAKFGLEDAPDETVMRALAAEVAAVLMPMENGESLLREILARWIPVIARRGA